MPSPDENQVLRILDEEGGESNLAKVAAKMGLSTDWARTIVNSLGRRDYIDVFASGKIELVEKGWNTLGKRPTYDYRTLLKDMKDR